MQQSSGEMCMSCTGLVLSQVLYMHGSLVTAATLLRCNVAKSVAKGCAAVNMNARARRTDTAGITSLLTHNCISVDFEHGCACQTDI